MLRYETIDDCVVGYDEEGIERSRTAAGVPLPDPPAPRWITPGALRDRMGAQKMPIMSSPDREVQALLMDIADRRYIDLDRPDLPPGLQLLVAKGFPIDPEAVISAPIQEIERP